MHMSCLLLSRALTWPFLLPWSRERAWSIDSGMLCRPHLWFVWNCAAVMVQLNRSFKCREVQLNAVLWTGLARTVYIHIYTPYIWWFPSQKYRIYTPYIWFWPTLVIYSNLYSLCFALTTTLGKERLYLSTCKMRVHVCRRSSSLRDWIVGGTELSALEAPPGCTM